jgi:triacylglycerol esterase/lipase EstA (alpha/beta hydrolase family)
MRLFTSGSKHLFFSFACVLFAFFSAFLWSGCAQKEDNIFVQEASMQTLNPTTKGLFPTNPPPPSGCDTTLLPVVMVHGFLAAGDTYAPFLMRFHSNGYCLNRLFAFDWNSISGTNTVAALDAFIDNVLAETGATQVNLMGHSAGGGTCYEYLTDAMHAAKVAHYVHIGSSIQAGPAGPSAMCRP